MPNHADPIREVLATLVRAADGASTIPRSVPVEAPLAIQVNEAIVAHLMRTPGNDIELALGFCRTEGLIQGMQDVRSVELCPDDAGKVTVHTVHPTPPRPVLMLTSACAGGNLDDRASMPEPLPLDGFTVSPGALIGAVQTLRDGQAIRREAGAVHAAAILAADGARVAMREDVGRHNAIDKAIGSCVYQGCDLPRSVLLSTGRASSEMVLNAAQAGIGVAASRSGSTSLGIELATELRVTLVCYVRSAEMTVLTWPERIEGLTEASEVRPS